MCIHVSIYICVYTYIHMNIWTQTIKWAVRCSGYQQQPQFAQHLQRVAVCCSVLLMAISSSLSSHSTSLPFSACCSMLQCVAHGYEQQPQFAQHLRALCCVLKRVAVCCSTALLRKMTYKDKASYDAMPPCTRIWWISGCCNMRVGMWCTCIFTHTCLGCKAVVCSISDANF